jgi:tetratricopeptide (TPR) repeat protein
MPMRLLAILGSAILAAVLAAPARADQAPWLTSQDWLVRRVVDLKPEATGRSGEEVGVCTFYSGGLVKADGSDIRVAVEGRRPVSHRILQRGPGDLVRIAFEVLPSETRYYIYYGNQKAPAPAKALDVQRGLLLEVRRWEGAVPEKLAAAEAAWPKAEPIGADFVPTVSFGVNPFAETDTPAVYHFTGFFVPPASGTYPMAVSSEGSSWLLIDGKEVIAAPGPHGAIGDARQAKPVPLTVSAHRLDFWYVKRPAGMTALVAWKAPDAQKFEAIPAKYFLQASRATLVECELPGERMVADFFPENESETWWPDQYAIRMQFKNLSKGISLQAGGKFEWDFGDGQTSLLASPSHLYLAAGDYVVSLRGSRAGSANTFRTKVHVDRNWPKQSDAALDPLPRCATEVAQYTFSTLDNRSLQAAINLFEHEGLTTSIIGAATEFTGRQGIPDVQALVVGLLLGDSLRKANQAPQAVDAYRQLEGRLKGAAQKAELAGRTADTLLADLHRWDDAEKEFQRILKTYGATGADSLLRRAHIGLGDIARHRGDGPKARQEYAAAAAIRVVQMPPNEVAVRVGTLSRYVEDYTRQKQWEWAFKSLADWAWEFPPDKLQGHWSALRAEALDKKGDRAEALLEATDLLAANPASPYAVRLLMLAAECQVAAGKTNEARLLLQTAVEDYPEDPLQDAARKRLKALGGPLPTDAKPPKKAAP